MRQLFTLFIILGLAAAPVFAAQSEDAASCVATAKGPIAALEQQAVSAPTSAPQMAAPVVARVGQPAPDFEANAYVGGKFKNMKLSDSKGRWVLLCFYPGDFTFVWPTELAAVATKYKELQDLGVDVMAISTDSRFSHKIWQEMELSKLIPNGVPFPLLSDAGGKIGKVYGVYEDAAGVDIRGRYIIDPDGVIQAVEILTPSVGRNVAETIRQLKAFQHVRATGEATPSGWQPGKPTLKPGPDLVGNVWKVWKPEMAF